MKVGCENCASVKQEFKTQMSKIVELKAEVYALKANLQQEKDEAQKVKATLLKV